MKQRKYIMSDGLAFSEEKDMKKLSDMASKGWVLDSFAFMGYRLKKADSKNLTYSIDYQDIDEDGFEDYIETFAAAGWAHICSYHGMHIFAAEPGTSPIYTDRSTLIEKYKRSEKSVRHVTITLVCLTLLTAMLHYITGISKWVPLICFVVALPFILTFVAAIGRIFGKWGKSV
ncbi:DUF2812 domain-containing protein [Bacillus sonorensis]|uniref:DUF2812 domain-containing protein n=2 Tax=Bacillus sonorensis TaxID=119858 RepID=M5P4S0_9BACI|nr:MULTISPECIES: DUF2812 domain-containing protein [Bacillus]TWK79132.1 hypothetical protein CHCC20335_2070 [Bacillus paralicheniformis]ASB88209.1 hypothetical protein S101395_01700 [Bacillus sonorensis]EME75026.1 Hypothetical protein BSONL12_08552 [Bacillus sonorensis L12]MCZ0071607.1 DUF2812 domain-containing protein [Bacillus sonorensis]MCZ0090228.1 DUF2812 domain-containing protein [Bacillus sonorensis]